MALDKLTKVTTSGITSTIPYDLDNINSTGIITASAFVGDGSGVTGVVAPALEETGSYTIQELNAVGVVTASTFIGDGSGITGVTASGVGIEIKDSGSIVGVAGTIDFGTNLNVSPASAGIVTVTTGDSDFAINDKIVHTGDTNTAIRFPAADTFTVETAGSERVRVSSAGSFGIGTNDPTGKLEIAGNSSVQEIKYGDGTTIGYFISKTNVNRGTADAALHVHDFRWNGTAVARIKALTGDDIINKDNGHLTFETNNGASVTERMRIDSNGDVGIGTISPAQKLDIIGNVAIRGTQPVLYFDETDTNTSARLVVASGDLYVQAGAAGSGPATSSGDILFTGYNATDINAFQVRSGGTYRDIWHSGNDGAGSGLDADTVDGIEASSFLRSDAADSASGKITFSDGIVLPTTGDGIKFGPGTAGNDDAHIEWLGGSNAGYLRFSTSDDLGSEYMQFGDYDTTNKGGTFTEWMKISRSTFTRNGNTIWHAGNDGTGSGLDADTLDGQEGSYYLNTATSFGGDVSGTYDAIVIANDSHTHAFNNLTAKTSGTGEYSTNGILESGRGSGGVALTINDGYGNANVTFNHKSGTPEQTGKAGRIEVNTDSTTGDATMSFELGDATSGVAASINQILLLSSGTSTWSNNAGLTFNNRPAFNGGTSGSTAPFSVDSTQVVTNLNADTVDGIEASSFLRSDADDTTTGNITISKTSPKLILSDTNTTTGSYPAIQFDTNNNQGVLLEHNEFDGELPVSGYGLVLKESPNNSQFPSTGTLTFTVLGEIYTGSATTASTSRVLTTADEGSGNGLDADTVDGIEASSFLRSDADDSASGKVTFTNFRAEATTVSDITSRVESGFFQDGGSATTAEGWPETTNTWYHLISSTHSNTSNYYAMQFAGSFFNSNDIYYRSTNNSGTTAWNKLWHSGNDGTGSGLDADTVDGIEGANLMTLDGTQTITGDKDFDGTVTYDLLNGPNTSSRDKIRLYPSNNYAIGMQSGITFGGLNDWGMTFQFSNNNNRGFWWGDVGHTTAQGAMALTTNGKLTVAHSLRLGYGESDTTIPGATATLDVNGTLNVTGVGASVGINVTNPSVELEVAGDILVGNQSVGGQISAPNHLGTDTNANIQVNSQGNENPSISLNHARSNGLGDPCFIFNKAGGDFTTPTVLPGSSSFGNLVFNGFDGANYLTGARIYAVPDGTPGANDMPGRLVFETTADGASSPSERMRIDSSGNVGIGTDNPSGKLHLSTTGTTRFFIEGGDGKSEIRANNGSLSFFTNQDANASGLNQTIFYRNGANESMRIDENGNVGINATNPSVELEVTGDILAGVNSPAGQISAPNHLGTNKNANIQVNSQGDNNPSISLNHARGNSLGSPYFAFNKAHGDFTTPTIVANSADIGSLVFNGFDGTNYIRAAQISVEVDGTPGTNDMPGRLIFSTTADGASTPTERVRIDSSGNVGINETNPAVELDVNGEIRASTGILFGTDTAAANTLDDYEEGTWTPVFAGTTGAGSYSYTSNVGRYTKVGNLVTVFCSIADITTISAGSGQALITGLPFTSGNIGFNAFGTAYTDRFSGLGVQVFARIDQNVNEIRIREIRENNTDIAVSVTDINTSGNNSDIGVTMQYLVS